MEPNEPWYIGVVKVAFSLAVGAIVSALVAWRRFKRDLE